MTCTSPIPGVIICGAPRGVYRRAVLPCPTCKQHRRMVVTWRGAYYGEDLLCLTCADEWAAGERMGRPFKRGWQEERLERGRRKWAGALTPRKYGQAIKADIEWASA